MKVSIWKKLLFVGLLTVSLTIGQAQVRAAEFLMVVDSSGSMKGKTSDGATKIEAAKQALLELKEDLQAHQVGMMVFGHRTDPKTPGCCEDIQEVLPIAPFSESSFDTVVQSLSPRGSTPLAESLLRAKDSMLHRDEEASKIIVVVTDGNETCGGDPAAAAAKLRELGINVEIHVVGFAIEQGEGKQLQAIADAGGGKYVFAKDAAALKRLLPEIVSTALRKTEIVEVDRRELLNETFDGEELDSGWEVIRPDEDRYAVADGQLFIVTQYASPWDQNKDIKNLVRRKAGITANDYEVSADVEIQITQTNQGAALMLQKDDQNTIELSLYGGTANYSLHRVFRFTKIVNGKPAIIYRSHLHGAPKDAELVTLKIVKRGIVFRGFAQFLNPKTAKRERVEVGVHAAPGMDNVRPVLKAANGSSGLSEATAAFDNVKIVENVLKRVTSGGDVSEDAHYATYFDDGDSFDDEFEVLHKDATHMALEYGLNLVSQPGKLADTNRPLKNLVLLNKPLPKGDYDIEVQACMRITSQHNDLGIVLYQDDKNALFLGHKGASANFRLSRQFGFSKVLRGQRSDIWDGIDRAGPASEEQTVVFKIEKRSRKYTASVYTADKDDSSKMKWVPVGEQSLLRFAPRLGFYANNHGTDANEVSIRFEKVAIRQP